MSEYHREVVERALRANVPSRRARTAISLAVIRAIEATQASAAASAIAEVNGTGPSDPDHADAATQSDGVTAFVRSLLEGT